MPPRKLPRRALTVAVLTVVTAMTWSLAAWAGGAAPEEPPTPADDALVAEYGDDPVVSFYRRMQELAERIEQALQEWLAAVERAASGADSDRGAAVTEAERTVRDLLAERRRVPPTLPEQLADRRRPPAEIEWYARYVDRIMGQLADDERQLPVRLDARVAQRIARSIPDLLAEAEANGEDTTRLDEARKALLRQVAALVRKLDEPRRAPAGATRGAELEPTLTAVTSLHATLRTAHRLLGAAGDQRADDATRQQVLAELVVLLEVVRGREALLREAVTGNRDTLGAGNDDDQESRLREVVDAVRQVARVWVNDYLERVDEAHMALLNRDGTIRDPADPIEETFAGELAEQARTTGPIVELLLDLLDGSSGSDEPVTELQAYLAGVKRFLEQEAERWSRYAEPSTSDEDRVLLVVESALQHARLGRQQIAAEGRRLGRELQRLDEESADEQDGEDQRETERAELLRRRQLLLLTMSALGLKESRLKELKELLEGARRPQDPTDDETPDPDAAAPPEPNPPRPDDGSGGSDSPRAAPSGPDSPEPPAPGGSGDRRGDEQSPALSLEDLQPLVPADQPEPGQGLAPVATGVVPLVSGGVDGMSVAPVTVPEVVGVPAPRVDEVGRDPAGSPEVAEPPAPPATAPSATEEPTPEAPTPEAPTPVPAPWVPEVEVPRTAADAAPGGARFTAPPEEPSRVADPVAGDLGPSVLGQQPDTSLVVGCGGGALLAGAVTCVPETGDAGAVTRRELPLPGVTCWSVSDCGTHAPEPGGIAALTGEPQGSLLPVPSLAPGAVAQLPDGSPLTPGLPALPGLPDLSGAAVSPALPGVSLEPTPSEAPALSWPPSVEASPVGSPSVVGAAPCDLAC